MFNYHQDFILWYLNLNFPLTCQMGDIYTKAAYGRVYGTIGPIVQTQMAFILTAWGLRPLAPVSPQIALACIGPKVESWLMRY